MAGWQIFAAIVLAVLVPVGGALLVYRVALWLSYDASDVVVLLKGLALVLAIALTVIGMAVFCGSFGRRPNSVSGKSEAHGR